MGTLDLLPATTYRPPSPMQDQRRRRSLNTIMEDEEEMSTRGSMMEIWRGRNRSPQEATWLSPLSDHFPTPRGNNFIAAPIYSSTSSEIDSTAPSSAPWTRDSFTTDATDINDIYDIYDVSSDEETRRKNSVTRRNSARRMEKSNRSSTASSSRRSSLPTLIIPGNGDPWAEVTKFKLLTSPVPPTPPPKIPMSPAVLSYLQSQEVPSPSAPPSLDGSLSSDQLTQLSAPPTPRIGSVCGDGDDDDWGNGVQLQPAAMATLQALSGGGDDDYLFEAQTEQVIELTQIPAPPEMKQSLPPLKTDLHRHNSIVLSPEQQRSLNSLTKLEIPSPGGFFSSLGKTARHTWHLVPITPEQEQPPPSSTTAENFYNAPWSVNPVERIVEVSESSASDGPPTAKPTLKQQQSIRPELGSDNSNKTVPVIEDIIPDEILADHGPNNLQKLEGEAVANIDRTNMWLSAQSSYLADLINPTEDRDDEVALLKRAVSTKSGEEENPTREVARRTVRFSVHVSTGETLGCPLPHAVPQESTYYRAFNQYLQRSRYRDTFVHRIPRYEALQSQRVSFPAKHRAQLLGKYQLSVVQPSSPKRRMSANVARGDEIAPEDPEKLKRDKEHEALDQMAPATWNVMAAKLLNGGRLIASPVAKRLARLSSMGPKLNGTPRDRARILDLGGQATCDWAWQCAFEYPNTKVYTVTTKSLRQLSNSNIRGPKNHRQVAVQRLIKLPFKDNQFDLISAREIYSVLKQYAENGEDEWAACLNECMRILKPGGYLEFSIMDSDIVNAGPLGLAKSVEFGFNLKTLGYDPNPTKLWLRRMKDAGFVGMKRAWVFLPMGAKVDKNKAVKRDSLGVEIPTELEAMVTGNTDAAASVSGLVGGWAWEKWLLRCRVMTIGDEGTLEGVQAIIEEGRARGAGWRTVSGWARKPVDRM